MFCLCRNPVAVKRPNSGVKLQQKKDSPALQHRGAGAGVRAQANPKAAGIRDARGAKAKDDKVRQLVRRKHELIWSIAYYFYMFFFPLQGKKADAQGDVEQKKFDGTGYDSDLVDSLERDIVSRNPNVHWYGGTHVTS